MATATPETHREDTALALAALFNRYAIREQEGRCTLRTLRDICKLAVVFVDDGDFLRELKLVLSELGEDEDGHPVDEDGNRFDDSWGEPVVRVLSDGSMQRRAA